ncbi:MAG: hypothetical protein N4A54_02050 [Peptostreptococcaceae bacterium]|jgi:hypothetical protein|nr:hypothetical protein [Peptostreptococcaceae bacterium]
MKVWRLKVEFKSNKKQFEDFELVVENKEEKDLFINDMYSGVHIKNKYKNLKLNKIGGDIKSDNPKFWTTSGILMFSKRAKDVLEEIIKDDVEFVEANYEDEIYYLVNILSFLDIIDVERSKIRRLKTGLPVEVKEYEFREGVLENQKMFKFYLNKRVKGSEILVTDEFKKAVEENNLSGFKFIEVWSNDLNS